MKKKVAEKIKKILDSQENRSALEEIKRRNEIHKEQQKKWRRDRPPPTRTFDRGPHPKGWKD
jgi:hypothetical protein